MYQFLKNVIHAFFPKNTLLKIEKTARFIFSIFYLGTKFQCPVCNRKIRKFIELNTQDSLCPCCGSLQRNRKLWYMLQNEFLKPGIQILDFSPSRCLYRKLIKIKSIQYIATDFTGQFMAHKKIDITQINEPSNSFHLIICYHILEHILDDKMAMQELYRVLKPNGICLIQTPFKEGEIYENSQIADPKNRALHFGQEDHVRIYSIQGLKTRLEKTGFVVEVRHYVENAENYNGFTLNEHVLLAKKTV